jgi:hypothetical protein
MVDPKAFQALVLGLHPLAGQQILLSGSCQFKGTEFTKVRHIGVGWSGKLQLVGIVAVWQE